jgi:outer membrane lipoprotein-sorting protein
MKTIIRITALAFFLAPSLSSAEILSLDQLSTYLNQLKTAKSTFTQLNPDNTQSKGDLMIKKPGRMRLEYANPNPALVVASNGQVAIFDKKSSAGPQGFPIGKTPLGIILKKNVNLSTSGMIIRHVAVGPMTKITAQDPRNPDNGNIELTFSADPVELRQWVVTDQTGQKTTVILGTLNKSARLSERLFNIEQIAVDLGQVSDR